MRRLASALGFLSLLWFPFLLSGAERKSPVFMLADNAWDLKRMGRYSDYWSFLIGQGYTGVDLRIADAQGRFYCSAPTLANARWSQQPDTLSDFLRELDRKDFPGREAIRRISLNLSALDEARQPEGGGALGPVLPLSIREIGSLALDLIEGYDPTDLTFEPFEEGVESALGTGTQPSAKELNLIVQSPGFERFLADRADRDPGFQKPMPNLIALDRALYPKDPSEPRPTVGLGDVAFALGKTLGKPVWAGCRTEEQMPSLLEHNLLLYRTVQYGPAGYYLQPPTAFSYVYDALTYDFGADLKKDILRFDRDRTGSPRPIANLVLGSGARSSLPLPYYIEPVANALLANGYDLRVTFSSFFPGADLYYVLNSEEWLDLPAFFDDLLALLDHRKSRFYGTVILHPLGEISDRGRWTALRRFFKIPSTETGWVKTLPEGVQVRGRRIRWRGTVGPESQGMTFIRSGMVFAQQGDVVLSEVTENETLALILKSGNHYLINGNGLHLEAAYFLSQLMGGSLQGPTAAYVTSDRNRTVALATEDTDFRIRIPVPEPPAQWRLAVFHPSGGLKEEKLIPGNPVFDAKLKKHELWILEAVP